MPNSRDAKESWQHDQNEQDNLGKGGSSARQPANLTDSDVSTIASTHTEGNAPITPESQFANKGEGSAGMPSHQGLTGRSGTKPMPGSDD